jgi:hypothetical protein
MVFKIIIVNTLVLDGLLETRDAKCIGGDT